MNATKPISTSRCAFVVGIVCLVSMMTQFALAQFSLAQGSTPAAKPETSETESAMPHAYTAEKDTDKLSEFGFDRYFVTDKFGRKVTCYLSKPHVKPVKESLPLVVAIQGSGSQSVFLEVETPEGKRIVSGGPEAVVRRMFSDQVRVMIVEKPGVQFLVQPKRPGSAEEGTDEYNRDFSLERWVEAVHACTSAMLKLPGIDSSHVLAIGHSEGSQIACELAAANENVSHVAAMAGGGPTQLFDFMQLARSGAMYDPNATPEERVEALMADWQKVLDEPTAPDKFILGHSHLRWSTFAKSSPVQAILKSQAKVFVAQGTDDTNSLPASAEVLFAELHARGRDVTYERVEGGNHGFMKEGDTKGEGWKSTNAKAIEWFLKH